MNRSEVKQCRCRSQGSQNLCSRYRGVGGDLEGVAENAAYYPDAGRKIPQYGSSQVNDEYAPIDPQTQNTISSMRKKACQFIRSESESSSSAVGRQCPDVSQYRGSNLLRNVNNVIDYVPQSEFLRKMKQQCQYLQNDQPNIFSTLDNCEQFRSDDCQRCIDTARLVLNMGDQIKCNKYKLPAGGQSQNYPCQELGRMNNLEGNQSYYRDPQRFCDMNGLNENLRLTRDLRLSPKSKLESINEEFSEKILQKPMKHREKSAEEGKKSEHVSRSKKPAKCRGRRKRKSGSSDRCESGEEFEPNLKKPHENSCERCWKYASPSRSPVNKPDQRYDPNFRRGHSCTDFEMGDGDLVVTGRHISPCKNLQPITSREKVPTSPQAQSPRQQPEVIQQKTYLSPRKTQPSPQETRFGQPATQSSPQAAQYAPQAAQYAPRPAQFSPQKSPCIQQQPQDQDKHDNTSYAKIKDVMYNYSQSKSPEKNVLQPQSSEGHRKSPNASRILQSEAAHKPRPKSYTSGAPALPLENIPDYILNTTEYCGICLKPRPNSSQNESNKKCVRLNGNKAEPPAREQAKPRPATGGSPLKSRTPVTSNRPQFTPQISSTPKKSTKSKASSSPDQCTNRPSGPSSPQSKRSSPKSKSPKSPTNSNKPASPDLNASVYPEVLIQYHEDAPTPKKSVGQGNQKTPSPKTKSKSGSSPKKSPKNGSPRKIQSTASLVENLSPIPEARPQSGFVPPTEDDFYPGLGGIHDPVTGSHPIRDCWCPPRAPFIRGNVCNNPNPGQIFCCHCNWEENKKKDEQRIRNLRGSNSRSERSGSQNGEVCERQCGCDRKCRTTERPQSEGIKLECPYRAFQRDKKAANDMSWEEDYQKLKEYCLKNPGEVNYQLGNCSEDPSKSSEYLPAKYAVFYMTEKKDNKGDDVEVLVEELTQVCPKKSDSRTRDITDKMKRILECPSDSMALRFQKGVSESCKAPRSSRILYF